MELPRVEPVAGSITVMEPFSLAIASWLPTLVERDSGSSGESP